MIKRFLAWLFRRWDAYPTQIRVDSPEEFRDLNNP
jgi:hypothetical protein